MVTVPRNSAIPPLPPEVLADLEPEEREAFKDHCVRVGFEAGLCAALGPVLGVAIYESLAGRADKANEQMAPGFTRAVVCKWDARVRRNLGWPLRHAANGKGRGRKPKTNLEGVAA